MTWVVFLCKNYFQNVYYQDKLFLMKVLEV
jgi:hypothetical protein